MQLKPSSLYSQFSLWANCRTCASSVLKGKCPNCGGELVARPRRPAEKLVKFPASTERVFKPDPIALAILQRCSGEATLSEIVDDLAATYSAPRERILADVTALLRGLADKRLLEL